MFFTFEHKETLSSNKGVPRMERYDMGAGIMVVCGKKTLVLKRSLYKVDPFSGYWNFPGGSSEKGESPYETAVRETEEEIGISVPFIKVSDHIEGKFYTMFIGHVGMEFKPQLDHEHSDFKWIPLREVLSLDLHPKDKRCFEKYLKRLYQT